MKHFKYEVINGIYYHIIVDEYYDRDYYVAKKLKIDLAEYKKMLVNKFAAIVHYNEVMFKSYVNTIKAMEYLDEVYDSLIVVKKLIGGKK